VGRGAGGTQLRPPPPLTHGPEDDPSDAPAADLATALAGPAPAAARRLLGCYLRCAGPPDGGGPVVVRLTEVEAYAGQADPGSHAYRGPTPRTAVMFGPPGHAYVYFSYGMHWCLNVVCSPAGTAAAVLVRAGEVVSGIQTARARRPGARDRDLARGPARLTRALGVDRAYDGAPLLDPAGPLALLPGDLVPAAAVRSGPRVGVAGAGAPTPWRYWIADDPTVSAYRPAIARRRAAPS